MLLVRRFDPAPCGFPVPKVRPLPVWTSGLPKRPPQPMADTVRTFTRGRYALTWACRHQGVGPEGALAVPAYHCLTMIDGALSLGARVVLYDIDAQLRPSMASLETLLSRADAPIRSVLVTHYFGAPVDLEPVVALCRRRGLSLIEDCSHVMVQGPGPVTPGGLPFGVTGDHAVASPYKFSPAPFGGLGWSRQRPAGVHRAARTPWRLIAGSIQQRFARRWRADVLGLPRRIGELLAHPMPPAREWDEPALAPSAHYDAAQAEAPADAWSQSLWHARSPVEVAAARIAHYQRMHDGLRQVTHARPLWPTLPEHCVPYMFPLWLEHPEFHFPLLKRLGVPIWRWDEMAISGCRFALAARTHLLHLPCHQSLRDDEIAWMIEAVRLVLQQAPTHAYAAAMDRVTPGDS